MHPFKLDIGNLVKNGLFTYIDNNSKCKNFEDFEIDRTDGKLTLITKSKPDSSFISQYNSNIPGRIEKVYENDSVISFFSEYHNIEMIIKGVAKPKSVSISLGLDKSEQKVSHSFSLLEYKVKEQSEDDFLIEYIDNVDFNYFFGNSSITMNTENKKQVIIGNQNKFKFPIIEKNIYSSNAIMINIEGVDIYLYQLDKTDNGLIVYTKILEEEKRNKIRECLSFLLGREMLYTGYGVFDKSTNAVYYNIKSITKYINYSKAITQPPASLSSTNIDKDIETEVINKLIKNLYNNYDSLDLKHIFKLYWYAIYSHTNTSSVHWGATIEAFKRSLASKSKLKKWKKIVDTEKFNALQSEFNEILNNYNFDEVEEVDKDIKDSISENISRLNKLTEKKEMKKLFKLLNISFSKVEEKAWNSRDLVAHGEKINVNGHIKFIKDTKILKIIFHRLLLTSINSNSRYIDYCSEDYPLRSLKDSILKDSDII